MRLKKRGLNNLKLVLEKVIFGDDESYKIKSIDLCCNEIINNPMIDFVNEYFENSVLDDYKNEQGVAIIRMDTVDYGDYCDTECNYYKISHCPFCGEIIEISVENTVDKTEEFNELNKLHKEYCKKRNNCDSKKKTVEYAKSAEKLNLEIHEFYQDDSLKNAIQNSNDGNNVE